MKRASLAVAILLSTVPVFAQTPNLKINVEGKNGVTDEARALLLPLISANPHYTLVSDSDLADVHVKMTCMVATTTNGTQGVACSTLYMCGTPKNLGETTVLGLNIIVGPRAEELSRFVFADLIDETTPDRITLAGIKLLDSWFKIYNSIAEPMKESMKCPGS